ncbi:MAG: hypothetical protein FJZ97_12315, partial [Chloroflexi bacterium]|nr:hypothetical protein [Chloroflexota bacterium]
MLCPGGRTRCTSAIVRASGTPRCPPRTRRSAGHGSGESPAPSRHRPHTRLGRREVVPMPRHQLIVNPAAGAGNGGRSIPAIERLMKAAGLAYDLVRTERRGHAIELARQAALSGADVVVACGGDGTSNEVINGLKQAEAQGRRAALGVLCVGRGNDFAFAVGIPADLPAGVAALAADGRRTIDLGRVRGGVFPDGRYFASCVGIGFDAVTTIQVSKMPRWGG